MDLREVMEQHVFVVAGNTADPEKFAYKIKQGLIRNGCRVYAVGKELSSINEVAEPIDIIDLCVRPDRGLTLIRECRKNFKCIVIQPGAESEELVSYLQRNQLPYINNCLLVGLERYGKK